MSGGLTTLLRRRSSAMAILYGAAYGIVARALAMGTSGHDIGTSDIIGGIAWVMSLAFLFVVPMIMGVITLGAADSPSIVYRLFAPWVPVLLLAGVAAIVGWEGSVCIASGLPVMLVMASLGGLAGRSATTRRARAARPFWLLAPVLLSPIEQRVEAPVRLRQTVTEIVIAAPPDVVWPLVASVDSIRPSEQEPALFTALGFPRPVSATLSHPGVGGVRIARFERGLAFTERVTEWVPGARLSFTIDATNDGVDGPALDQHVTIGGEYFDVMTGGYELHPLDGGRATRLVLRSEHRTSTRFNFYAGWWADRVMESIQNNIMAVHKRRAERGAQ